MRPFSLLLLASVLSGAGPYASLPGAACATTRAVTPQAWDQIRLPQGTRPMLSTPLEALFGPQNPRPSALLQIGAECTACHRGYVGTWQIRDERLYLIHLEGCCTEAARLSEADLNRVVGGRYRAGGAFADWVTDTLVVGNGQRLDVIGNEGIHDREIRIAVRNGRVTDRRTVVNRAPVWGAESDINGSLRAYANALRERLLGTEPGPQGVRLTLRVDVDGQVELCSVSLRRAPSRPRRLSRPSVPCLLSRPA